MLRSSGLHSPQKAMVRPDLCTDYGDAGPLQAETLCGGTGQDSVSLGSQPLKDRSKQKPQLGELTVSRAPMSFAE